MKGKDLHPRLLYLAKLSFRMEGKIKCYSDKVKLKKFIITKPLLYEMLKGWDLSKKKIKNMNSKMTTNSQVLRTTPETKQKLSKQLEQERITEMEITWRVIGRGVRGGERRYRE